MLYVKITCNVLAFTEVVNNITEEDLERLSQRRNTVTSSTNEAGKSQLMHKVLTPLVVCQLQSKTTKYNVKQSCFTIQAIMGTLNIM